MKTNAVIYHASCLDGFTSAWTASLALGDSAVYIPVLHGKPPPLLPEECQNVYILDFAYPKEVLLDSFSHLNLVLLDHHKSSQADLQSLLDNKDPWLNWDIQFDMNRSGAYMSWQYFHPLKNIPNIIRYVQDRDLWNWKLAHSKEISMYMTTKDFSLSEWTEIYHLLEDPEGFKQVVAFGEAVKTYTDHRVKRLCHNPAFTHIDGHFVPCVNDSNWQSEIGNVLSKDHYFAVVWSQAKDGTYVYSLRSDNQRPDEVADVSEIAKIYGGGGHRHAAGFARETPPLIVS